MKLSEHALPKRQTKSPANGCDCLVELRERTVIHNTLSAAKVRAARVKQTIAGEGEELEQTIIKLKNLFLPSSLGEL